MSTEAADPDADVDVSNLTLEELSERIMNDETYSDDVREVAEVILEGIREGRIDATDP